MTSTFWQQMAQREQEAKSGGGVIGEVTIDAGWKSFATGFTGNSQEETFFPAKPGDDASYSMAQKKARMLQPGKTCSYGAMIRIKLENAVQKGAPATWSADQFEFVALYSDAWSTIVGPSLERHGIAEMPWTGWVRIAWKDDPYAVAKGDAGMKADNQGNLRFPRVAYLSEVYANENEAAQAAIGVASDAVDTPTTMASVGESPWGDQDADGSVWESTQPEIYAALQSGKPAVTIAKDLGISPSWVMKVKKNYVPI